MADKNFLTPSQAVLHKNLEPPPFVRPQAWGDNTPRSTELKKQVLDAVQKVQLFPKP